MASAHMKLWMSATASDAPAIVFVPELEQWLSLSSARPKALSKIQQRGAHDVAQHDGFAGQWLVDQPIALAPLLRAVSSDSTITQPVINVDLVSLRPDLNAVWASPLDHATDDAAWALVAEVLAHDGLVLQHDSGGAFLALPSMPEATFQPVWRLQGTSLDALMPTGPDARRWIQLISESQIVLHQHSQQASTPGHAPQGVWFWGMGTMPTLSDLAPRVQTVVSQSKALTGLSQALGVSCHSTPSADIAQIQPGELVEFSPPPTVTGEGALGLLDDALGHLLRRLALGRLRQLELSTREQRWTLTSGAVWRSWVGL